VLLVSPPSCLAAGGSERLAARELLPMPIPADKEKQEMGEDGGTVGTRNAEPVEGFVRPSAAVRGGGEA